MAGVIHRKKGVALRQVWLRYCTLCGLLFWRQLLLYFFHHHRRAISQHFCNAAHYFVGIIPHVDDGIASHLPAMLHHQLKGVFAGSFAELHVNAVFATENCNESTCHISKYAPGAYGDASHQSQVTYYFVTFQRGAGGNQQLFIHHLCKLTVNKVLLYASACLRVVAIALNYTPPVFSLYF